MWNNIKLYVNNTNWWRFLQYVLAGYASGTMYFETDSIWRGVLNGLGILSITWIGEFAYRREIELKSKQ